MWHITMGGRCHTLERSTYNSTPRLGVSVTEKRKKTRQRWKKTRKKKKEEEERKGERVGESSRSS